jgi:hypothetical protein
MRRNEPIELLTNDVSFRGAFLRTDAPPSARQLVRISLVLPVVNKVVSTHAMVIRTVAVSDPEGKVPGFGVQFWGPMDDPRTWEQFIYDLKHKELAGIPAARVTDKVRRSSERFQLSIEVKLDGKTAVTRDVSLTGMAVRTDLPMPIGTRARLDLAAANGDRLTLDVVVRRKIEEPGFRGLGVEFIDLPLESKVELVAFLEANTPDEDDDTYVSFDESET